MSDELYEPLLRRMAVVLDTMNQTVDELRLVNGRLETRIEQHDQVLARLDQRQADLHDLLGKQMARQDAAETTLTHMDQTLDRLDRTLDAFLKHLQHPSGNGR